MASTQKRYASKRQKRILLINQDFKCALCGVELAEDFECDHMVPFSEGGETSLENLQALCKQCHANKTNMDGSRQATSR